MNSHCILKDTNTSTPTLHPILALNVSSKRDFTTYHSCQNLVERRFVLFQRKTEKSFKPNVETIYSSLPTAEFLDLTPRTLVHYRKTLNKEVGGSGMSRNVHKALSSPGDEEGRTTGGIQCEEDAPSWEFKVLGRQRGKNYPKLDNEA